MLVEPRDLLRVHACAFNARDVETLAGQATAECRCIRDGELIGEGPSGLRKLLALEYAANEEMVGRVMTLDGDPILCEWVGQEGRRVPSGAVRITADETRISELRIDHDPKTVDRLVRRAAIPYV